MFVTTSITEAIKDRVLPDPYEEVDFKQANHLVKSRQRYFRKPKRPADILGRLMARKGYSQTSNANELQEVWKKVVGEKWNSKTKVGLVKSGVLEIYVANSSVNQQLEFKKKKLLDALNKSNSKTKFKNIRFRVGNM